MKKALLIILLFTSLAWAQEKVNEKYSYQDFQDQTFVDVDPSEFNDTTIAGSNFFQFEKPFSKIFPDGMKNVIFLHCNLDNVDLSNCEGCKFEGTTCNKQMKMQNDDEYWIVEKESNIEDSRVIPIEPVRKDKFIELNVSTDPSDIPVEKVTENILKEAEDAKAASLPIN